jgi:hypothetical protein
MTNASTEKFYQRLSVERCCACRISWLEPQQVGDGVISQRCCWLMHLHASKA